VTTLAHALSIVAERIRRASRLTILTGAGVSAASGVPTFRGAHGLWRQFRAEDLATPAAFARDPRLVWEWYAWRREQIAACQPNPAHDVIARWSGSDPPTRGDSWGQTPLHGATQGVRPPDTGRLKVAVVTQNVDDLHVRAGTRGLVRLHGSIWELLCADRCASGAARWRDDRVPLPELPPRCPHCGGLARPGVVWFGETLGAHDVEAALRATACDVFLTVGTSAVVYPAAGLMHQAKASGAFTAEINQEPTPASAIVDVAIQGGAEQVLPGLDRLLR
jgi:NAD-dependent deacetylase